MRKLILASAVVLLPSLSASAGDHERLRVVPDVFDPEQTNAIISRWVPFSGRTDPAIIMSKILPTNANAAAVASVEGVSGATLDELGFDVFNGGHCGGGAPRFNVTTVDGFIYFFGCFFGVHTPAPDKPATFTRVRFRDQDAFAQLSTNPPFHFGQVQVASIDIVFDEGTDQGSGFTAMDNIDVNGELVGRPRGSDDDRGESIAIR